MAATESFVHKGSSIYTLRKSKDLKVLRELLVIFAVLITHRDSLQIKTVYHQDQIPIAAEISLRILHKTALVWLEQHILAICN